MKDSRVGLGDERRAGLSADLSAGELGELATLLQRLAAAGGAMPNTPRVIWDALAGVVPRLAVELFLVREGAILLTWRDDAQWRGWHVPGGFVGVGETLGDAGRRIGARELGVELEVGNVVGDYAWVDHPCGAVLSLLCACTCVGEPNAGRYFDELPELMVHRHNEIIGRFRGCQGG